MHFTPLIIYCSILLKAGCDSFIVYHYRFSTHRRPHYNFQNIKEFARITCTISEESVNLCDRDLTMLEDLIFLQSFVKKQLQVILLQ